MNNPNITTGSENFRAYPAKTFLGTQGAFAYHFLATLDHEQLPALKAIVEEHFPGQLLTTDSTKRNANQEALAISFREEFCAVLIEATTNSIPLLRSIDHLFKAPRAPWEAFPDMKPIEAVLSKQGSLEFWWDHIWLPFWESCTASEKEQYLLSATSEWREVLSQ
jgi:hypothetical protein